MYSKKQLELGKKTEFEHAHLFPKHLQKAMAERIAKDHLNESPRYYSELKKMERRIKK